MKIVIRTLKLAARMLKLFAAFIERLSVLHNYFGNPTKLFSELYLIKFLDTSAKTDLSV